MNPPPSYSSPGLLGKLGQKRLQNLKKLLGTSCLCRRQGCMFLPSSIQYDCLILSILFNTSITRGVGLLEVVQISFFPQPSAVIRIKDSSYDFHPENSKHLLANIAPAPQARGTWQNGIAKRRDSLGTRCGTV